MYNKQSYLNIYRTVPSEVNFFLGSGFNWSFHQRLFNRRGRLSGTFMLP